MSNIEEQYKQVSADLKKTSDDLKAYAEESQKEIKKHQELTSETKAAVDELLTKQGELQARVKAAEQAIVDADNGKASKPKTLGEIVANSEDFEANAGRVARAKGSFSVQAAVTSDAASAGDLIEPMRAPGINGLPQRQLTIRDLLNFGKTQSNSIEYVKQTGFTNNAAAVGENPTGGKPESDLTFDVESAPVATIAHFIHATKQVLDDAGMLQSYIDGQLRYGLKLAEENQLLKGSGVGVNINGLYTQAAAYVRPAGANVTNENHLDRLRLAMLQTQLAEYSPDGIVLNPIDWANIELLKETTNAYLFGGAAQSVTPTLWGLPVVATQALAQNEFLTGAFKMGAHGWDREEINVEISTEDRDNFVKNMVTIRCEERVGLTVYRPESFVKGDFTFA